MPEPNGRVEAMTSGLFFRCCALGYEANHYQGCELSPKEQYLKHADGRDEGLCGIDENSSDEAAHFYLSIYRAGYPVTIRDGRAMADRFLGVDRIGIVPAGVIPNYCESYFPGEKILDFMNLDKEDEEKILEYITWQDIPEQNLV